jgi:hypothetical protein
VTIHPVCVVLPGEVYRASALWRVVELGALVRRTPLASRNNGASGSNHRQPLAAQRTGGRGIGHHVDALLALMANRLSSTPPVEHSLWLEKREVAELLIILDEGLALLGAQANGDSETLLQQQVVAEFLNAIRQQLPVPRKPTRSQTSPFAKRSLAAAAGAD